MRNLTIEENNVLAYIVVDPIAWWERHGNEKALADKVARHKKAYETAVVLPNYKTRAERDALVVD